MVLLCYTTWYQLWLNLKDKILNAIFYRLECILQNKKKHEQIIVKKIQIIWVIYLM